MTQKPQQRGNQPAFPLDSTEDTVYTADGLTIREYFAAAALPAVVTTLGSYGVSRDVDAPAFAAVAVSLADHLLAALAVSDMVRQAGPAFDEGVMIDLALPVDQAAIKKAFDRTKEGQ